MDQNTPDDRNLRARREFLARCGKFAVVTPPAMALLFSTTRSAWASGKGNNGWGNGPDPTNPGSDHGATSDTKTNSNLR